MAPHFITPRHDPVARDEGLCKSRLMFEGITFSASPLDRADRQRRDRAWLMARLGDQESMFLPFLALKPLIKLNPAPALARMRTAELPMRPSEENAFLLGLDHDAHAVFALDLGDENDAGSMLVGPMYKFIDARSIAPDLPPGESGILAHARSRIDWHARHRFCACCGHATAPEAGGQHRRCQNPDCGAEHFPRTDPVVIMLVEDGQGRILLGRQAHFPKGNFSALAGFVDQGERIEEAVQREIREEVGINVENVRYIASQPWPFPSSLMIGCFATALNTTLHIDTHELEQARWFTREEAEAMLVASLNKDENAPLRLPPSLAIAHHLIRHWLEIHNGQESCPS